MKIITYIKGLSFIREHVYCNLMRKKFNFGKIMNVNDVI